MGSISLDSCKDRLEYLKNNIVSIYIDAQQITNFALASDDFNQGYMQAKINILQKLHRATKIYLEL